ncbi:auxin efflux carrier component 5-like [Nymphaea colorata]|nr:auxin efflux carrier component 5-like [Nymphaea colorata]
MIGSRELYNVVSATFPLYVPVVLGYGSVRWWKFFSSDQCQGINKLVAFIVIPFFTFDFISGVDPFHLNRRFLAADAVSKAIAAAALLLWAKFCSKGSYLWTITGFSLSTLSNTLVVGVPLLNAMYGKVGQDLAIQSFLLQAMVWFTVVVIVLEVRKARNSLVSITDSSNMDDHVVPIEHEESAEGDQERGRSSSAGTDQKPSLKEVMKVVWLKIVVNPNTCASIAGLIWALVSTRWHFGMPSLIRGSVLIMSKGGGGMAMFSIGLFMASQEKLFACGPKLVLLGIVLRFIAGPAAMAAASIAVGLRGTVLNIAIIQAALPQAIASFVYAKEYEVHPEVISTAVILGTLISLPVLIAYYVVLELLN